jgi:hypothetical protein
VIPESFFDNLAEDTLNDAIELRKEIEENLKHESDILKIADAFLLIAQVNEEIDLLYLIIYE